MHEPMERSAGSSSGKGSWVAIWILLAVSLPFLLGGLYLTWRSASLISTGERAQGQVIDVSGDTPTLTVSYRTADGQVREVRSAGSDLYGNYQTGDAVAVYYDPAQPRRATLDLFVEMWLIPLIMTVFGVIFACPLFFFFGGGPVGPAGAGRRLSARQERALDQHGRVVQAEYAGFRLEADFDDPATRPRGTFELYSDGEGHRLIHDGRARDPLDPAVQQELGIRYVALARWRDPATGREHLFRSARLRESPDRLRRGLYVAVRVHPEKPELYRFEPPFGPLRLPAASVPGAVRR